MQIPVQIFRRSRHAVVFGAGAAVLALGIVGTALATTQSGPFEVDDGADSYAVKGYTYAGSNATGVLGYGGNASATNATGVAGYVTSPLSVGVTGYAASSGVNAYGVYGYSNTGNGVYGVANTSAVASIYGVNSKSGGTAIYGYSTGNGILGTSTATNGIVGTTQASSTTSSYAGVLGNDNSTAGFHYGVAGNSPQNTGTYGQTATGDGIGGYASGNGVGGYFLTQTGTAIEAVTAGIGGGARIGLATGEGAVFEGYSGTAAHPTLVAISDVAGTDPFATFVNSTSGNETFIVQAGSANYSGHARSAGSDVQISGDLYVHGAVYSYCDGAFPETNPHSDCKLPSSFTGAVRARSSSGTDVEAYSPHQSVPTMEDFGEAELVNGQATVQLDRTFASTIDARRPYLVFAMPEGDCRGLYIASKSPTGFVVRELTNGHSTLAFQYRIVAHPYADGSARMPALPAETRQSGAATASVPAAAELPSLKAHLPSLMHNRVNLGALPQRLPPPAAPRVR